MTLASHHVVGLIRLTLFHRYYWDTGSLATLWHGHELTGVGRCHCFACLFPQMLNPMFGVYVHAKRESSALMTRLVAHARFRLFTIAANHGDVVAILQ